MSGITPNNPPFPAYRATDKECFAYDTVIRRWPIILDSVIADIQQTIDEEDNEDRAAEGVGIINSVKGIKEELAEGRKLRLIQDNKPDTEEWNKNIKTWFSDSTWVDGTWLFNECYIYRRIEEIFNLSQHWVSYDVFERQKNATFKGSHNAVFDLARKMPSIIGRFDDERLEIVYNELIQVCLWGNATDLSLLTNMTEEDIKRLQAIEKDHLKERKQFILVDDTDKLWDKIKSVENGRIEFVLDNSGFEVFVDIIFADWLLQCNKASTIVFNCKSMPWFVSDVTPKDIPMMFDNCLDADFFPDKEKRSQEDMDALAALVTRWQQYVKDGRMIIRTHDFWCSGLSYWYMKSHAEDLFNDMKQSDLIIYKGDLNYRKLTFDCDWPVTTPFREAIGPDMAKDFTNIIALRTNKADVIVGLTEQTKEYIEKEATKAEWRFSGKYAVVEYN
ncbi:hypothetical protein BDB01DRAFT_728170 [Pilobolus umbonatus]|nr:hypothetical protein BDB01DRAFT_728170 [Pilobolus umbonatus]